MRRKGVASGGRLVVFEDMLEGVSSGGVGCTSASSSLMGDVDVF